MLKKFSKFLLLSLLIFAVSTSSFICLADELEEGTDTVNTVESNEVTETTDEEDSTSPEIHSGDLYLIGDEVVMDKLVDGNVFILGNKVKITGQVNGSLYVLANKINFDGCLIRYSIFVCADYVYYNNCGTYEGDAYIAANTLTTTYTSYIARDIKALCSDIVFKSGVGRDADLLCNTLSLGEGEDTSLIYGDLRYTANNEISIPEGALQGSVTYTKQVLGNNIVGALIGFGTCVVTALAIFIILNKLTPNFIQKISDEKFSFAKIFKAFGIGLATIIIVSIFIILLVGTFIGILLAIILTLLFAILYIIAMPVLAINITNSLRPALKIDKNYMFYLVLALVSIILYGIGLIPFVGCILSFIINTVSIGLIVNTFLPHKELTDEEKIALETAKENKEKIKQEKLEAKADKKQKKLEAKEAKQQEKLNKGKENK